MKRELFIGLIWDSLKWFRPKIRLTCRRSCCHGRWACSVPCSSWVSLLRARSLSRSSYCQTNSIDILIRIFGFVFFFWLSFKFELNYDFGNETVLFEHLGDMLSSLHAQPVVAEVESRHGRVCHESGRDRSNARTAQSVVTHRQRLVVHVTQKVRGRYHVLLLAILQVDTLAAEIFRFLFYYI